MVKLLVSLGFGLVITCFAVAVGMPEGLPGFVGWIASMSVWGALNLLTKERVDG